MPESINWETIKNTPVSVSLVLLALFTIYQGWARFDDYHDGFITRAQANQEIEKHLAHLETKVDRNTSSTDSLQRELRMKFALARVEALETRLYTLNRDQADPDLIHEIEIALGHARDYCDCLLAELPNCQHLEPGRAR